MNYQKLFCELLDVHEKMGYLRDNRIKKILEKAPLLDFFSPLQLQRFIIYDAPVLFYYKDENINRTVSAPHMISMMLSIMELSPHDHVLILGAKGGFMESIIAKAVSKVSILEENKEIAKCTENSLKKANIKNVIIEEANPLFGWPNQEIFTKVLITGAIPIIPANIYQQTQENGLIIVPFIHGDMNNQIIFQIIKRKINFDINNYGNVIFSPLYCSDLPNVDEKHDITMEKIITNIKIQNFYKNINQNDFSEKFIQIPKLAILPTAFDENEQISKEISGNIPKLKKVENENSPISLQKETIWVTLFNPEKVELEVSLEFQIVESDFSFFTPNILLHAVSESKIKIPIEFALKNGFLTLNIICKLKNGFRIAHSIEKLFVVFLDEHWSLIFEKIK